MTRTIVLSLGLVSMACGGSDPGVATDAAPLTIGEDLLGMWTVSSHLQFEGRCEGITPVNNPEPDHLKFVAGVIDGRPHVQLLVCDDAAGVTCNATTEELYSEPIPRGARHATYTATGDATSCNIRAEISSASVTGGGLTIDYRMYTGSVIGSVCTPEDAALRVAELRCVYLSEILGARP